MDAVQAVAVLSLLLMIRRRNDNFRLRIRTILYCLLIQRRQDIQRLFLLKRLARRQRLRCRARRAWVWPRPQNYFEELLLNHEIDHQWKEHFRVTRDTFRFICQILSTPKKTKMISTAEKDTLQLYCKVQLVLT